MTDLPLIGAAVDDYADKNLDDGESETDQEVQYALDFRPVASYRNS